MEQYLLQLAMLFIAAVASFMFAMTLPFIFFYGFFGIPYALLPDGFWKTLCLGGMKKTWAVNRWCFGIPVMVVKAIVGGGDHNHGNNRRRH